MTNHRRAGIAVAALALAGFGLLGLTGCAPAGSTVRSAGTDAGTQAGTDAGTQAEVETGDVVPMELVAEEQVLAEVGFEEQLAPEPSASPTAGPDGKRRPGDPRAGWRKRHAARVLLRGNTLHGEAVVQTKDGTKTVVVQRGTVTAITDTSVTLKSTDGFTLTWTYGDKLHVVEHRTSVKADAIKVGDEIGVAGARDGDRTLARLIVKRR